MKKDFLKYGNLVAFVLVIVFNALSVLGILGGYTTREVSYMYKSLLTPADYAFSIWSVIYILLAVVVYLQMKKNEIREQMGYWFMISCFLNVLWIIAWQYRMIGFSFIVILALLLDLIMLMKSTKDSNTMVNMSVGLYTGWINVAMLANLGTVFVRYDWKLLGLAGNVWAVLGLAFGLFWVSFFTFAYSNIYYALAACWGYFGIVMGSGVIGVKVIAIISMVVFAGIIAVKLTEKSKCCSVEKLQ